MPLIILGLIVVLGGCLLIYYQLGPKVTMRLKGAGSLGEAPADETNEAAGGPTVAAAEGTGEKAAETPRRVEKVIYVYGDGEREERTLSSDDDQPADA